MELERDLKEKKQLDITNQSFRFLNEAREIAAYLEKNTTLETSLIRRMTLSNGLDLLGIFSVKQNFCWKFMLNRVVTY